EPAEGGLGGVEAEGDHEGAPLVQQRPPGVGAEEHGAVGRRRGDVERGHVRAVGAGGGGHVRAVRLRRRRGGEHAQEHAGAQERGSAGAFHVLRLLHPSMVHLAFLHACAPACFYACSPQAVSRMRSSVSSRSGGLSWPSLAATIVATVASPVMLVTVRHMSRMRSTPRMSAIPALGTPTASRMMTSMMMPAPGTAAVPMEASTAVSTMVAWAPRPS